MSAFTTAIFQFLLEVSICIFPTSIAARFAPHKKKQIQNQFASCNFHSFPSKKENTLWLLWRDESGDFIWVCLRAYLGGIKTRFQLVATEYSGETLVATGWSRIGHELAKSRSRVGHWWSRSSWAVCFGSLFWSRAFPENEIRLKKQNFRVFCNSFSETLPVTTRDPPVTQKYASFINTRARPVTTRDHP